MKNKKKIILSALLIFLMSLFFIFPVVQAANGVALPTNTGLSERTVAEILTKLLNWLLEIVGIIAIIGFVISGIMYLVSTGDDEMIKKAKKYMTYCVIGIVVVLASFAVVQTIDTILNAGGSSSTSSSTRDPYSSYPSTGNREADPSSSSSSSGGGQYDPKASEPSRLPITADPKASEPSRLPITSDPKASEKSTEPFVNASGTDADIVPF